MTHPFIATINQKNAEPFISAYSEESCVYEETKQIVQIFKEAKKYDWKIGFSEARDKKNFEVLFEDAINLNAFLNEMSFQKNARELTPEVDVEEPEPTVREFSQKVQYKLNFGGGWENFKVRVFAFLSWLGAGSFQMKIAEKIDSLVKDLFREIDKEFGNLNEKRALQAMEAKNIVRDIRVESPREKRSLVALVTAAVIHRDDQNSETALEA